MAKKSYLFSIILIIVMLIGLTGCDRRIIGIAFSGLERKTSYVVEDAIIEIPNIVRIVPWVNDGGAIFSQKFLTVYMDYNVPYSLEFEFIFLGDKKQVEKIIFNFAKFIIEDQEYDIIISEENPIYIGHSWYNENLNLESAERNDDKIKLSFQKTKQLIINESNDIIIDRYYVGMGKLYFDYESNDNISVEYNITIELRNGDIIPINDMIIFSKIYEERREGLWYNLYSILKDIVKELALRITGR